MQSSNRWIPLSIAAGTLVVSYLYYQYRRKDKPDKPDEDVTDTTIKQQTPTPIHQEVPLTTEQIDQYLELKEAQNTPLSVYSVPKDKIVYLDTVPDVEEHLSDWNKFNIWGLDCEWRSDLGAQRTNPVAVLQLANTKTAYVIKIHELPLIPECLRALLESRYVTKVGVAVDNDVKRLFEDYSIQTHSWLDLRSVLQYLNIDLPKSGLASLTEHFLKKTLNKDRTIVCSDWEDDLSEDQIQYAAADAMVSVDILNKILTDYPLRDLDEINHLLNRSFKGKTVKYDASKSGKPCRTSTQGRDVVFDNIAMLSIEGELLGFINAKKKNFYLTHEKGLATETTYTIKDKTYSAIQLTFKEKGKERHMDVRTVPNSNRCIVCGRTGKLIRYMIVPRRIRQGFPDEFKSHTYTDIHAVCVSCDKIGKPAQQTFTTDLSIKCGFNQESNKSAVRIRSIIKTYMGERNEKKREGLLLKLDREAGIKTEAEMHKIVSKPIASEVSTILTAMTPHEIQLKYRQHFLDTMQPQYMPEGWDIHSQV